MFGSDRLPWVGEGLRLGFRRSARLVVLEKRDPGSEVWTPIAPAMPLDEAQRQMDEQITLRGGDDDLRLRPDRRPWTRLALVGGLLLLAACAALVAITLGR
jgi:hypothetical protein